MNNKKVLTGFKWSIIDTLAKYFFTFGVSIILARLLDPKDFGLFAIAAIFIAISRVFIDGGMGDSLIRKTNADEVDFNTVFSFNFILSLILYTLLFFLSPLIALFFTEPNLIPLIRVSALGLIIGSFSIVQIAILRKQMDFKKQAKITLITSIVGGLLSVLMAYFGFEYWSLVLPVLLTSIISAVYYWYLSFWKPKFKMDKLIFKEHFAFSSYIMLASLFGVLYNNMFFAFIAKFFSPIDLGYFYKADSLQKLPSSNIDIIVRQVTYPILSAVQESKEGLFAYYVKMFSYSSYINSFSLLLLSSLGEPLILFLFGEKWLPSVSYFQLLCFAGIFFPLTSININMFNVNGRSDLFFKMTVFRLLISIPTVFLAYYFGIDFLIYGIILSTIVYYLVVIYTIQIALKFSMLQQLSRIKPGVLHSFVVFLPVYYLSRLIELPPFIELVVLASIYIILYCLVGNVFKTEPYVKLQQLLLENVSKKINKR